MNVIQTNSFVNCILKSIRFYIRFYICGLRRAIRIGLGCVRACVRASVRFSVLRSVYIIETGPSCSHELVTFLNYHLPLIDLKTSIKSSCKWLFIKNLQNANVHNFRQEFVHFQCKISIYLTNYCFIL